MDENRTLLARSIYATPLNYNWCPAPEVLKGRHERYRSESSLATGAIPWPAGASALRPRGRSPAAVVRKRPTSTGFAASSCFTKARVRALAESNLNRFLTHLAVSENVAAPTENQPTHLLKDGYDIRTVQELLEHKDVQTTMVYPPVLNRLRKAVPTESGGIIQTDRWA